MRRPAARHAIAYIFFKNNYRTADAGMRAHDADARHPRYNQCNPTRRKCISKKFRGRPCSVEIFSVTTWRQVTIPKPSACHRKCGIVQRFTFLAKVKWCQTSTRANGAPWRRNLANSCECQILRPTLVKRIDSAQNLYLSALIDSGGHAAYGQDFQVHGPR